MKCTGVKGTDTTGVIGADVTAKIEKMISEYKGSGSGDMAAAAECLARIHQVGIENVLAYFGKIK